MARIAFLDDNQIQLDIIQDLLDDYAKLGNDITATPFKSGQELINSVKEKGSFDIYILDMILPDMNGLEVASTLRHLKDSGKIIFLTASLEYAAASYEVEAFYYILKPINVDKFYKVLDRALELVNANKKDILIGTSKGDILLSPNMIVYAELIDRFVRYHLSDGRVFDSKTIRTSFRQAMSQLSKDDHFAFCGVSYIVNLSYVNAIDSDAVLFRDGSTFFPPKSAYADFKLAWRDFRLK